ncbi:MAG: hypothetical protein ACRYG4_28100 [Janthinobacterium lividum]
MAPDQFQPSALTTDGGARDRFLDELRATGNVAEAAARAGVPRSSLYRVRRRMPAFATAWDRVLGRGVDTLEKALFDRAINGVERTRTRPDGKVVERWREYSVQLAIFLLKARLPEIYGNNPRAAAAAADDDEEPMTREDFMARIAALRPAAK